jgi:pimeloyl-ACP methyl ester carboxylesterase
MRPLLIPLFERLGRRALRARGVRTRRVETPLGAMNVYDGPGHGSLPPVVLLHGLSASGAPWAPLVVRLLPHVRRVVVPEYPGHGFSPEAREVVTPQALFDAVTTALDSLLEEPALVVGNSLGGAVALQYAITRPNQVRGLVLLSPAGARSTPEEWRAIAASFDITSRAEAMRFFRKVYHRVPLPVHLVAHELAEASLNRRAVRELIAGASTDSAHDPVALRALPMPVLLVWGRSERLLPPSHLAYFREHLPAHAVIEEPEGMGHVPQGDSPGRTAERILRFARSVAG